MISLDLELDDAVLLLVAAKYFAVRLTDPTVLAAMAKEPDPELDPHQARNEGIRLRQICERIAYALGVAAVES